MRHGSHRLRLGASMHDARSAAAMILLILTAAVAQDASPEPQFTVKPITLPCAKGRVSLDYFAFDGATNRLWVPAGDTGSVDVIDLATNQIKRIEGFPVAEVELMGKRGTVGPSSVSVGDGVVYIGSRADSRICVIDSHTLKTGDCIAFAPPSAGMAAAPDGLIYVAATRELWATSGAPPIGIPAAGRAIQILSASPPSSLKPAGKIPLSGSAEGYAVDNRHGRFYTNLEETGQTVAIDVRTRTIASTWRSCDRPSGVAVDRKRGFVFVACIDHVIVLDSTHSGREVGSLAAGAGLDNIDYSDDLGLLYAAAADAAKLTIARVDDHGKPTAVAVVPATQAARSVVAGAEGRAYLIDPIGGSILKVEPN
jgi:hypothetical protein